MSLRTHSRRGPARGAPRRSGASAVPSTAWVLVRALGSRHRRRVRRARPGHLAGRGARRDRAGHLPADRRIVRGVRAHRLAQAARQPQRPAHDRGGRGLLPVGDHRPVPPAARADRVDPGAGAVGAVLRGAGADAADGRPARVARGLAAGGRVRAGAVDPAGRLAALLGAGRQPPGRLPQRGHRRRGRQGPALARRPRLRRGRGRRRGAMESGFAPAAPRPAAERRRQRARCCSSPRC